MMDLGALGWETMVVWECETIDIEALGPRLVEFIDGEAQDPPVATEQTERS